jgi:hypothetical protein
MYQYLFEPKAQNEYEESFNWYAQRSLRAALNFIESIDKLCYS